MLVMGPSSHNSVTSPLPSSTTSQAIGREARLPGLGKAPGSASTGWPPAPARRLGRMA